MEDFEQFVRELERARQGREATGPDSWVALASVPSTNRLARRIIADYESEGLDAVPAWFLAFAQSAGRGRGENRWVSPRGGGVYASRILPVGEAERLQTLPLLVGVGLCRALSPLLPGASCRLKWPNDLVIPAPGTARKVGGILIEAVVHPGEGSVAVVGFGVNLQEGRGGGEEGRLPPAATTLARAGGVPVSLAELAWQLIEGVERELVHLGEMAYAAAGYRELAVHHPGDRMAVRVGEERLEGTFAGIDDRGRLLLESGGARRALAAAEVIEEGSEE
jgi:BirA family biotin operon repressor/biotin-[acetyl-CoA-carboxylase] ligase